MNSGTPRRRVWMLAAAAFAAAALVLGYLGWKTLSPPPAPSIEKLNLALGTLPQSGLIHIAAAKGFFAGEGLEVTLVPVSDGKAGIDLVLAGKADIAMAAEVPFVLAVMKGGALSIAANMLDNPDGHAVIARRDRGIAAAADLAGKKLGISFGTSGEYFLWAFLIRNKLAPDSVTLVDLPPGQLAPALAQGTIDAAATWQPHALDAQAALGKNAVTFAPSDVYTQLNVLVARSDFLKQRRSAIEKLLRALLKAEQLTHAQPAESLALVAAWLARDAEALRPLWKSLRFRIEMQQSDLITLEDQVRWAMARGIVEHGPAPNFLSHLHLDALLAVMPERVTVIR